MGYRHTDNHSRNPCIQLFRECYAMEKIHGSSANLSYKNGELKFFGGGAGYEPFKALFDEAAVLKAFQDHGAEDIVVYGEVYGGKMQKMSATYGPTLKFVAFEVCSNGKWFDVPSAEYVARKLGFDFVPYARVSTDQASLDAERDRPSRQAIKNGCGDDKMAEGVVLRPIRELVDQQGGRIITKHKRPEFSERKSKADTQSTEKLQVLNKAQAVADEFVTEMRLEHVLDALKAAMPVARDLTRADIPAIIAAMLEDVGREGAGEFEMTKEVRKAIGNATADLVRRKF